MTPEDAKKILQTLDLKITKARTLILSLLEQHPERHLSAEQVHRYLFEQGEDLGLATVYRVLGQFEQAGLVIRHHFQHDSTLFELNNQLHHDHAVCLHCGTVTEFYDAELESRKRNLAKELGFTMSHHHLQFYGWCQKCKELDPNIVSEQENKPSPELFS